MLLALVLAAVGLLGVTGLGALLCRRAERAALWLGVGGCLVACATGGTVACLALLGSCHESVVTRFATPLGPLHAAIDPLSSFFLLCVFLVSGLAAVYGSGYLRAYLGKQSIAPALAGFNLLVASMALVVVASDAVIFLMAWEAMSVVSFFLVTFESDRGDVRRAGVTYLIASHLGIACLLILFVMLGSAGGTFDFASWAAAGPASPALASIAFLLALVGFGTKAGFWPFHVWLPDAHPAAPSHVSAVMSGVMIKMGIYGLLRTLTVLGPPPSWWGATLLGIGVLSAILGVLHALAQHDLKRLLAYHSVENIGIIAMGLGLGLLGRSLGNTQVAFLGLAGGLLHVLNHGIFKGLLFQGAGSVLHATGLGDMDQLGGLARRMPHTAATFLVGAAAISGLPPLNGFASEWLIYVGAFYGAAAFPRAGSIAAVAVIVSLALVGGLAAACFVKAFGTVFLGTARGAAAAKGHESPPSMTGAMWAGAALCFVIGLGAVSAVSLISPAALALSGAENASFAWLKPLQAVSQVSLALLSAMALLAALRSALLRPRQVAAEPTWGCGYPSGTARMQYTAASFAAPTLGPFSAVFHRETHIDPPVGPFPERASHAVHLEDRAHRLWTALVNKSVHVLSRLDFLQNGRVQLYLAYVLATLVVLLVWQAAQGAP